MSKLSESIFLIFQKLTKDWKQPGEHLVTYMRKPVPERTQKAWPNNSLIRRLVWINFLKRSQELLFKTMENAPLICFRDDQDCHPYERYRAQKHGGQVSKKRSLAPVRLQDTLPSAISHYSLPSPDLLFVHPKYSSSRL